MIWNPVGILNTSVGISIPYPERKDVGNVKNATWERAPKPSWSILVKTGNRWGLLFPWYCWIGPRTRTLKFYRPFRHMPLRLE